MTAALNPTIIDPSEVGRLRWRCRRGMRELDLLLALFLECHWAAASEAERGAFRGLLERPDPEVHALLLGQLETDDEALARVLECIRRPA